MSESPSAYYRRMRQLAGEKRELLSLSTQDITLSKIRNIYRAEGIVIDRCPSPLRKLKAAYFNDEYGCTVLLNMKLPEAPRLFAMIHELKHHYEDRERLQCFTCQDVYDSSPIIEIGAEVFAAEFIFPEDEFRQHVAAFINGKEIVAEDVVHMHYYCPARVSYQFFTKSLERLGYISRGKFAGVQFHKLHEELYGSRHYHSRRR